MQPFPILPILLIALLVATPGCTQPLSPEAGTPAAAGIEAPGSTPEAFRARYESLGWQMNVVLEAGWEVLWRDGQNHPSHLLRIELNTTEGSTLRADYGLASDFSVAAGRWHCLIGAPDPSHECSLDYVDWFSAGAPAPLGIGLPLDPAKKGWDIGTYSIDALATIKWHDARNASANHFGLPELPFGSMNGTIRFDNAFAPVELPLVHGPAPLGAAGRGPWTRTSYEGLGPLSLVDPPLRGPVKPPAGIEADLIPAENQRFSNAKVTYAEAWSELKARDEEVASYAATGCLVGARIWLGTGAGSGPGAGPATPFNFSTDTFWFYIQGDEGIRSWNLKVRNHSVEPLSDSTSGGNGEPYVADCQTALQPTQWAMTWPEAVASAGDYPLKGWHLDQWLYSGWAAQRPEWMRGFGDAELAIYYSLDSDASLYVPAGQSFSPLDGGRLWARVPPATADSMVPAPRSS